jgi:hypothetical protein
MDRHELTRIQRAKDRSVFERAMLDAMIEQATNLPAMRIGDRDPDKGMDTVISPDGGQAIAGLRLFNASISPDQIIKSTQPSDSPIIRLDYKSHKEKAKTTITTSSGGKVKILFSQGGQLYIGGYVTEPVPIPGSLLSSPSFFFFENMGGDDYIIASGRITRSGGNSTVTLQSLSSIPLHNWTFTGTYPSIYSGIARYSYGNWTFVISDSSAVHSTYYNVYGGAIIAESASGTTLVYSYPFPAVSVTNDSSTGNGITIDWGNSDQTVAAGFKYTAGAPDTIAVTRDNLAGISTSATVRQVSGNSFVSETAYLLDSGIDWQNATSVNVTLQNIYQSTSTSLSAPFTPAPLSSSVIAESYHPD